MKSAEKLVHLQDLELARLEDSKSRHIPGYYYTSPDILELEKEKLFMKDWLMVGRIEEFPNPGDYRVIDIIGESIIICRDDQGELNALTNVCRHRGVAVAEGEGNRSEFMCPFHAWTYDLKGNLITAPEADKFSAFDFSACQLPSHKIESWAGFIFINLDPNSPSLGDYLDADGVREAADFLRAEDTRIVDSYTYILECNWKMMVENNIDMYHLNVIHAGSFGDTFASDSYGPPAQQVWLAGALRLHNHGRPTGRSCSSRCRGSKKRGRTSPTPIISAPTSTSSRAKICCSPASPTRSIPIRRG